MKHFNIFQRGFTLIELLVVVLIIGILSAIALPQYQKAVWKSRYIQAKTLAKQITDAEEAFYMANGVYTPDFDALDVSIPPTVRDISCSSESVCSAPFKWGSCTLVTYNGGRNNIQCVVNKNGSNYLMYVLGFTNSNWYANRAVCVAFNAASGSTKPTPQDISYQVCLGELGKKASPISFGGNSYAWSYP